MAAYVTGTLSAQMALVRKYGAICGQEGNRLGRNANAQARVLKLKRVELARQIEAMLRRNLASSDGAEKVLLEGYVYCTACGCIHDGHDECAEYDCHHPVFMEKGVA